MLCCTSREFLALGIEKPFRQESQFYGNVLALIKPALHKMERPTDGTIADKKNICCKSLLYWVFNWNLL